LLSVNLLSNFFPWNARHGSDLPGHESCTGDTVDSVLPGIAHVRSSLFAGHLANWQSLVAGGSPLVGVPDLGLLDPLSLPYFVLPLWLAPAFVVLLEFVVGIGGTFLFLRRLNVSRPASMLAGLIFVSSGFMVMWTNWPQTRVAALIPALFWATERLIQRVQLIDTVLIALVLASMLLGGFPAVTGFALYLAGGYLIVRLAILYQARFRAGLRTLALAAVGAALGLLLSMVQILPFLYFYNQADLSYRAGDSRLGLPLSGLLTLVAPNAYGLCSFGHPVHGPFNAIEVVAYVGAAAIVLAVAGAAFGMGRGHRDGKGVRGYFLAGTAVVILLAWVSPTARSWVGHLPPFSGNFIGRIRSVLGFALAVLAAIGFDWLTLDRGPRRQRGVPRGRVIWAVGICLGTAACGVIIVRDARQAASAGGYWHDLYQASWIPGLLLVVVVAVVVLSRVRIPHAKTFAFVVVPLVVAGQGAQFFHAVLPGDSPANFYPTTATHRFLETNLGDDRFASSGGTMYPATSLYYGLRTPTGHEFTEPAWQALLQAVDPTVINTPTFSAFTPATNQTNIGVQPVLDRMAVKYFVLPPSGVTGLTAPMPSRTGVFDAGRRAAICTIPSQPLRGITFEVVSALSASNPNGGVTFEVQARSGDQVASSGRYLDTSVAANSPVTIAIAGENLPSSSGPMQISIGVKGASGNLVLAAHDGSVACAPNGPMADGMRLVYADPGSIVYQRLNAMPRIRWASRSIVITDAAQRVAALERGLPQDEVALSAPGASGSGEPGTEATLDDSGDTISASTSAHGAGYLVVADAMQQPGWSVTIDGKPAHLVPADDAMIAINVPAGHHIVVFHYRTPGQVAGAACSVLAILIIIAILGWSRLRTTRPNRGQTDVISRAESVDTRQARSPELIGGAPNANEVDARARRLLGYPPDEPTGGR
jgi:hypothetical protein